MIRKMKKNPSKKKRYNYSKDTVNAAFECFKILLKSKSPDINTLVNAKMADGFGIVDICALKASEGLYYARFFGYLMNNNGKLNWRIDFNQTLVPLFAAFTGDYQLLRELLTNEIKSLKLYTQAKKDWHTEHTKIWMKNHKKSEYKALFPHARLNDFKILGSYQVLCLDRKKRQKERVECVSSPLFWCMRTPANALVALLGDRGRDDYVLGLHAKQQELLCFGYLRAGGIEYPDNIAGILMQLSYEL